MMLMYKDKVTENSYNYMERREEKKIVIENKDRIIFLIEFIK